MLREGPNSICASCKQKDKNLISRIGLQRLENITFDTRSHMVFFIMDGLIQVSYEDGFKRIISKENLLFVPSGAQINILSLEKSNLLRFSINDFMKLCDENTIISFTQNINRFVSNSPYQLPENIGLLKYGVPCQHFLKSVLFFIDDKVSCPSWQDLIIKEFLLLLRMHYSKQDLYKFFYMAISMDSMLLDYVYKNWRNVLTVSEMANNFNMSNKAFSSRFFKLFGKTPLRWIIDEKSRIIYEEIKNSGKLFKYIAIEFNFSSESHFTNFCKKTFGKTPTEIRSVGSNSKKNITHLMMQK